MSDGSTVNSYRLGSSPDASAALEGLVAQPVRSAAKRSTASATTAASRASSEPHHTPGSLCYRVQTNVLTPATGSRGTHVASASWREPLWRWKSEGSTQYGNRAEHDGRLSHAVHAVFTAVQQSLRFLQQKLPAGQDAHLKTRVSQLAHQGSPPAALADPMSTAAVSALVKTVAAEVHSVSLTASQHDSSQAMSRDDVMLAAGAYGSITTAAQYAELQLASTGSASCHAEACAFDTASVQLPGSTGGTVVISGGLGGLGTLVAAAVAAPGRADTALLLLARSGRANWTPTLQVCTVRRCQTLQLVVRHAR